MKQYLARCTFFLCALFLAGCHEEAAITATPPEPASTATAVSLFSRTCAASLPGFNDVPARAKAAGMVPAGTIGPIRQAQRLPRQLLVVGFVDSRVGRICAFVVDSNDDPARLGQEILKAARKVAGSGREKRYPSSFYEYAIRLSNGSLLTQDSREKGGARNRSIFFLSAPISEDQVPYLIYD